MATAIQKHFQRILLIAIALQFFGYSYQAATNQLEIKASYLLGLGMSEYVAHSIPILLAFVLAWAGYSLLKDESARPLIVGTAIILFLTAMKALAFESTSLLTFVSRASRYLIPTAMLIFLLDRGEKRFFWGAETLVRWGLCLTFIGHGTKSLFHHASFGKLLSSTFGFFGITLSQEVSFFLLDLIGIVDIAVAIGVLFFRFVPGLWYMSIWALMAAFTRIFHGGIVQFDEVVVRAVYYLAPLALFALWRDPMIRSPFRRSSMSPKLLGKALGSVPVKSR